MRQSCAGAGAKDLGRLAVQNKSLKCAARNSHVKEEFLDALAFGSGLDGCGGGVFPRGDEAQVRAELAAQAAQHRDAKHSHADVNAKVSVCAMC